MLLAIVFVLVAPVIVVVVAAALKPDVFEVSRQAVIRADAPAIFDLLNDFHRWRQWSPWEGLDPSLARTYSGPPAGVGAVYAWEGNKKVGAGRMEILESVAASRLVVQLEFLRPWRARNLVEFLLTPAGGGGGTEVVWKMNGPQPFATRLFSVVMPLEKLVGRDFERGLARLKHLAEGG